MSKKAKTSTPIGEVELERAAEDTGRNTDVMDDSIPQGASPEANPPEADPETHVETSSPHATPPSPVADPLSSAVNPPSPAANPPNPAANPPSPAKDNVNPPSPAKDDDDVIVTNTAYTAPGNPVGLSKHIAKDEFAAMGRENGRATCPTMLIFLFKIFIPDS